jgi:hypothetical protein
MKDWSVEEALAAQEAYVEAGGTVSDPASPIAQWAALQQIDEWQADYEAGTTFVLLHAVAECAKRELVMPDWVVRGFLDRIRRVTHHKVRTLDEAFGTFLPKGAKLLAHRQKREKGLLAYFEVERQHKAGDPIDRQLFKSVGESMNIGASKVRDYYYHWKHRLAYKKTPE